MWYSGLLELAGDMFSREVKSVASQVDRSRLSWSAELGGPRVEHPDEYQAKEKGRMDLGKAGNKVFVLIHPHWNKCANV